MLDWVNRWYIHLKDHNQVILSFYLLFSKIFLNVSSLLLKAVFGCLCGVRVLPAFFSTTSVCLRILRGCITLGMCLSPVPIPASPPGCSSSPWPLHCLSHCWGSSETSSPLTSPPYFPLPPRRPPLFSARSRVGFQPRHISLSSCSAPPFAGCHFPFGLHQTVS